jgi:hypothetical protein
MSDDPTVLDFGADVSASHMSTQYVQVVCDECGREESDFGDVGVAYAWLAGHYITEHPDVMPDFAGTGGDA